MAKELFITQEFSQEMLLAGESLIKHLDETESKAQVAFWLLDAEEKTWGLIIASSKVEDEGARNYYKQINDINKISEEKNVISLHDIEVVNKYNRFVKALLKVKDSDLWSDEYWKNTRLGKNFISNVCFEDMYIYRVN
ncbi:MAG: hypothetical protein GQ569_08305 [Methylococcaceae bacterium]|nr:hypothetical protein [Methylococcaceae bacterium]